LAVPKAFLILAHDAPGSAELARHILEFAREHLAPYKRVRRIEFVSELPKTISGKIRRVELRQMEVVRRQSDTRGEQEHFEEDFS
jgi:acetyl-CoA synthetase